MSVPSQYSWIKQFAVWLQLHPRIGYLLALLAGASLVTAFAPFGWWPMSILAPAVLMFAWMGSSAKRRFWQGYFFGLGLFGSGISWVFNSIYEFGHAPFALALLITLLFVLFLALYPALTGLLAHGLRYLSPALGLTIVYPTCWTLMEWLRSWVLTGFPWLLLGEAHVDTPLAGIIPIFGVLGASWLSMAITGILLLTLISSVRTGIVSLLAIAAILGLSQALLSIRWTAPSSAPLTVSLVQANISQDTKWQPGYFLDTLDLYRTLTQAHWDSDIIIWPETAVPAVFHQVNEAYFRPLTAEADENHADLLLGTFYHDEASGKTYNSIVRLAQQPAFYHKRHLVPFGEYFPLRMLLSWMMKYIVIPMSDLSSGEGRPLIRLDDYSIGVSICYEDAYGNEVIEALPEANLLVNVSNDAWFGESLAPHQHLQIARLRALESGRYLLRSTNTGISAVIAPNGEIVAQSPQFETHVLTVAVKAHNGLTPYARWENWGMVMLLCAVLLTLTVVQRFAPSHWRISPRMGVRVGQGLNH